MLLIRNIEISPIQGYTVKQVADMLGVSVATVHNYITSGKRTSYDHRSYLAKESGYIKKETLVRFLRETRPDYL
jgi:predicted transcriptional regulator